jgi:hypothetical protein
MITICKNQDDEHAPFPHYLVQTYNHIRERDQSVIIEYVYVVCAHCDHWIERTVPACPCREDCHDTARNRKR